jgi:hypothetical protein
MASLIQFKENHNSSAIVAALKYRIPEYAPPLQTSPTRTFRTVSIQEYGLVKRSSSVGLIFFIIGLASEGTQT